MEYMDSAYYNEIYQNEEKDEELPLASDTSVDDGNNLFTNESISNNNSGTSQDIINNSSWKHGELAWARMSIYPFWPCMVTYDPNAFMTYQKVQTIGKSKTLMIHVHFFNDYGRHSWIPAHHMIPFCGIEDFRKRARLITDVIRKKEPKFAAALTIKPNIFLTWQKAVAEAMDVLYELDMSSLDNFKPQLRKLTNDVTKRNNSVSKKRKRKDVDNTNAKKTFKSTNTNNKVESIEQVRNMDNETVENNLNLETPPVSPPNEDDLRTATFQKQKRISKMINKLQPPDFEVYFERNFFTIKEQHVDATDEEVREYLYDIWENMGPEQKVKYRATYKIDKGS